MLSARGLPYPPFSSDPRALISLARSAIPLLRPLSHLRAALTVFTVGPVLDHLSGLSPFLSSPSYSLKRLIALVSALSVPTFESGSCYFAMRGLGTASWMGPTSGRTILLVGFNGAIEAHVSGSLHLVHCQKRRLGRKSPCTRVRLPGHCTLR